MLERCWRYKRQEREDEKLLKKENWFRVSSGQQKPESVIFVTATPGSELARNIKQRLKTAQIPVRVAENSGPKLSQILVKTNPYQADLCGRAKCFPCESRQPSDKGGSNCRREGVVYSIECLKCPGGKVYIGETSSTAFVRGKEHQYQYKLHKENKKGGENSAMGRHIELLHEGEHHDEFSMKVIGQYLARPHQRQVAESITIDNLDNDLLINTRKERSLDQVTQFSGAITRRPAQ